MGLAGEEDGEGDDGRVAAAVAGDLGALETLLRELGPPIGAGLSIDKAWRATLDAEDVLQVTYLEAFLRIGTLRTPTLAGFRAWLSQVAENNLRDAVRALSRSKRPDAHGRVTRGPGSSTGAETLLGRLAASGASVGSRAAGKESVARLRAAVEALPESYRLVVRGLDLEERGVSELAAEMKRSPGAVHMLRSRAHDRLRELMGASGGFSEESP